MNATNMLDHQKIILENISDDKQLFQKELEKSIKWLSPEDQQKLYLWLKTKYWSSHKKIILAAFDKVAA